MLMKPSLPSTNPTHPAPPLFSPPPLPYLAALPAGKRPVLSLHWPPPLPCSGPCVYSRDNPLPTATMQPDLQVKHFSRGFPVPTCSSFSEKRGESARVRLRGDFLSLSFPSPSVRM